MKYLVFLFALVMAVPCFGEPNQNDKVKYRVEFEVVYNAVSADKAEEIIGLIMRRHANACKVKTNTEKVASSGDDEHYIRFSE